MAQVIPKRMVDTYCYIHATYTVDTEPSKDLADGALYSNARFVLSLSL